MKPLLLFGPTGSGKTALAVALAKEIGGEVVNADSRLFYRGMDIGTAKPTEVERQGIPHYLIDMETPNRQVTAAQWREKALGEIVGIHERGKRALVVGGTGFYMKILLAGWDLGQTPPDPQKREGWMAQEEESPGFLYKRLTALSPERASDLTPEDYPRLVRALELVEAGVKPGIGNPLEAQTVYLNPPRQCVEERMETRIEVMWRRGLPQEAEALWEAYPESPVLGKTIGYSEFLEGGEEEQVKSRILQNTKRLAKRQRSWGRSLRMDLLLDGVDTDENLHLALQSV